MTVGAYDAEIAMALELIAEFGQVCQWKKSTTVADDPEKPWRGGVPTVVTYNPSIAFVPASDASSGFGLTKLRQGADLPTYSTFGLMAPNGFEPEITDTVLRGGEPLVIAVIDKIQPAEDPVLYILGIV